MAEHSWTTWITSSISATPWRGPEMPEGQLEAGLRHVRAVSAAFCGSASLFPTSSSSRCPLTSSRPPSSRCKSLRRRHWPSWSQGWLGSGSLGAGPVKEEAACSSHSECKCFQEKGSRGAGQEGERNHIRVLFQAVSRFLPNPGVQMALRVFLDMRQVWGTFKLPHQLVLGYRPPEEHRFLTLWHSALACRCCVKAKPLQQSGTGLRRVTGVSSWMQNTSKLGHRHTK